VLPVERRVRRPADFATTVRDGRRTTAPGLVVHVASSARPGPARAGFVVGKAVGSAVTRNRIRRRLRHLLAPRLAAAPAGIDVVVRVLPPAATMSRAELAASFARGFDRAVASAAPS
jgi:ribonuclease P protein component